MNAQDCLQMLREIRDCAFATTGTDRLPHVRIIDVMLVDEHALYFCTTRGKDFYKQLEHNPYVAITGLTKDWKSVRLSGPVSKLDNQKAWIDRIFKENPSMENVYPGDARYVLEAFCVREGEIEMFDLASESVTRMSFTLGESTPHARGFFITEDCIGCGTCKAGCPQQCISEGEPFVIDQMHCLHCGYCFENCPVEAIERLA